MPRVSLKSVAGRIGMACYAIWVALALATQGATPCPTHDPRVAAELAGATMPVSMAGMSHDRGSHDRGSHDAMHHACTCVGCGCCVPMLDLCAPSRTLVPAPAAIARGTTLPLPPRRPAAQGADRRLPFANGPPAGAHVPV
jgi:hypothetical protein